MSHEGRLLLVVAPLVVAAICVWTAMNEGKWIEEKNRAQRERERARHREENHWHFLDTERGKETIAAVKADLKRRLAPVAGETETEAAARVRVVREEASLWMFLSSGEDEP